MTNKDVINAWVNGCFLETANLSSDGRLLRSYGTVIAENRGGVARITTKKYSVTTSRHTNAAAFAASQDGLEVVRKAWV
mgnify:CR=1 FL=1